MSTLRKHNLCLITAGIVCLLATIALVAESAIVIDLFSFEIRPLLALLGPAGIATVLVVNAGLIVLVLRTAGALRGRTPAWSSLDKAILAISALTLAWVAEWVFMEKPITVRLATAVAAKVKSAPPDYLAKDFDAFSLTKRAVTPEARDALRVAYERIFINNPEAYITNPVAATIDKYAARFDIDPSLLFTINYVDSWYGEATSGPVPFLGRMTSEGIRDVVQIHVPGWFIESPIRRWLIASPFLENLAGHGLGFKLRYAVHKATLDVSSSPLGASTFTNIFLVLKNYPEEFEDILAAGDAPPLQAALRDAFAAVDESAILMPCEEPYSHTEHASAYYDVHRKDLKKFARAAYYLTALDFDFASRSAALLLRYRRDYYKSRIGDDAWNRLPAWQQNAMLAMVQDVYVPNVGRLGYNLYALPELNCTALEFVASEAQRDFGDNPPPMDKLWRPKNYEVLWAGASSQLAVMNEIWSLTHPTPIPGIHTSSTLAAASEVVSLNSARL